MKGKIVHLTREPHVHIYRIAHAFLVDLDYATSCLIRINGGKLQKAGNLSLALLMRVLDAGELSLCVCIYCRCCCGGGCRIVCRGGRVKAADACASGGIN